MQKHPLNAEQTDLLATLFISDAWAPLETVLYSISADFEKNVMKYDLNRGPDGLVIEKARAEGAARFIEALKQFRSRTIKVQYQDDAVKQRR